MINKVLLEGRISRNLELRKTKSNKSVLSVSVAVDKGKDKEGKELVDFVSFTLWDKTAENFAKYQSKGDLVSIEGHMSDRKSESNGKTVYSTEIIVDRVSYLAKAKGKQEEPKLEELPPVTEEFTEPSYYVEQSDLPFY